MKNKYPLIYKNGQGNSDYDFGFFETKDELHQFLKYLETKQDRVGRSYLMYSIVFPKGSLYPTDRSVSKTNRERNHKIVHPVGDFAVKVPNDKKVLQKSYDEDLDATIESWSEEGGDTDDIYILNEKHGFSAPYYYRRDVLKEWGEQKPLFA